MDILHSPPTRRTQQLAERNNMHLYSSIATILALGLTTRLGVCAAPTDGTYPLVISRVVPAGAYNLTYWNDGPADSAANAFVAPLLDPSACGTNDVACSNIDAATNSVCSQLINVLAADAGNLLAADPRAICLGQLGNQCCVSWSGSVGTIPQGALFPVASKIFDTCFNAATGISGLARNVVLNGGCVTECLSNFPNGCV
ncbi:hypothetical protein C8R43DRAFT_26565 [Mycena crocata]|nr:hypothetical protein C8R43DRAFT_26565 [Mycena crocata]